MRVTSSGATFLTDRITPIELPLGTRRTVNVVLVEGDVLTLVDTESGRDIHVQSNSETLRARYAAAAKERHEAIGRFIRQAGSEHLVLFTDADWLIEIVRFVAGRRTLRRHTSLSRNQRGRATRLRSVL